MKKKYFNNISYQNRNKNKAKIKSCSSVLLDTAKDSFEHEYDRAKRVESKANMILVLSGVVLTILVAYLKIDLDSMPINWMKYVIKIIYFISITCYVFGLKSLMKVLTIKGYEVLNYDKVFSKGNFECEERDVEEALIINYNQMIKKLECYNEDKIKYYIKGFNYVYVGQILILILCIINFIV